MRRSYILAAFFAVIVVGWVASGQFGGESEAEDQGAAADSAANTLTAKPDDPISVRVSERIAQPQTRDLVLRGRTEVNRWVNIKAETKGRVTEVVAKEGARVARGDVVVKLAMEDRAEKLAEAEARVHQRQIEFDAAKSLRQKGFRAETKTAEAAAQLGAAIAYVAQIAVEIDHTEISAPFAGVIDTRDVELGDFVEPGDVIARVVDEDPYLVVGQVSELDIDLLKIGDSGVARLANGETVKGKIRYIATVAEPSTRTFRVELEVPNRARTLRGGVTAEIRIPVETVQAHFLSPALLTLDDFGVLGVRSVNSDATVEFYPVSVFATQTDGIWVTGLPATVTIITVGQEFVRHGEVVVPVPYKVEQRS
jgi:multidrug efflux system membrane fusion protein